MLPLQRLLLKFVSTLAPLALALALLAPPAAAQTLYTAYADSVVPPFPAVTDSRPIEVGVKFRVAEAGHVVALRFYKGAENTGLHVGHLWANDASHTLLATQTFTGETAVGWQEVALSPPVAVAANTTYVASYYSEGGFFAADPSGLVNPVDFGPLELLANGADGGNGVFVYDVSGFPTNSGNGFSYFVDVAFTTDPIVDTTPPTVTGTSPVNGALGVAVGANVSATFSEAIDPASLSGATFQLYRGNVKPKHLVRAAVSYDAATRTATLDPAAKLNFATRYIAKLVGGSRGVRDLAGNPLATVQWSFITEPPPAPPPCMRDASAADFAQGVGVGTNVAADVSLASGLSEEFSGDALPPGWSATAWNAGGAATVSGDQLDVDGARAGTDAVFGPGRTLELRATFAAAPFEHVGLATDLNAPPWAIFSTDGGATGLVARTNDGTSAQDTPIPLADPFAPHDFRIVWTPTQVQYAVDGVVVATHALAIATPLRPLASDFDTGGGVLAVDRLRLTPPYTLAGSFTSRVGDAGQLALWGVAQWTSTTPPPTSLAISVRTGLTPVPDAFWSPFVPLPTSGAPVFQIGRYLQYRADLATTDADQTPRLSEIHFACTPLSADDD